MKKPACAGFFSHASCGQATQTSWVGKHLDAAELLKHHAGESSRSRACRLTDNNLDISPKLVKAFKHSSFTNATELTT